MQTSVTQPASGSSNAPIETLDAARAMFQKIKSTPGADRYVLSSLDSLYSAPPFCPLRTLDSILRTDPSIRPQSFVGKTVFKHRPTQDIIEKLQQIATFLSDTYGLQVANKVACFPAMDTLADTLKADTARIEHILRASDDTLAHFMSDTVDIKMLLHKRRLLDAATSISRSLLALKSTTFLINKLLSKGDVVNAIAIYYLAEVAIRTSRTVLVDTESMYEDLKKVHDRLAYQLRHHVFTILYGKLTGSGDGASQTVAFESDAGGQQTGAPDGNDGRSSSAYRQDTGELSSIPCISLTYSPTLYNIIRHVPFLPLCVFLRSIVARAYKTDDLIHSFIDSLGVLKETILKNNPFFTLTTAQDAIIKSSALDTMPPELYSILLGQSFLMLYESELASDSFYNTSNFLRGMLYDSMESQLTAFYTQAEYDYTTKPDADRPLNTVSSLNLHRADHLAKLRRLLFNTAECVQIASFPTIDVGPLKEFAEISRYYLRRVYFSMLHMTLFYGSFLTCYRCYLQTTNKQSIFDQQKPAAMAPSMVKNMMHTKSKAGLPTLATIGTGLSMMGSMPSRPPMPSSGPAHAPAQATDAEHVRFRKVIEIVFYILGELCSSPDSPFALEILNPELDTSQHEALISQISTTPSFSANLSSKRILSASFSSNAPTGKLVSIREDEQIPFMDMIFAMDARYPFIGPDVSMQRLLGMMYEHSLYHVAQYCAVVIRTPRYARASSSGVHQSQSDRMSQDSASQGQTMGMTSGMSTMARPSATGSSMFSLSWIKSLSSFSLSASANKSAVTIRPDYWNTLFIESYVLSFYYCSTLLSGSIKIEPIDDLFSQFFSRLLHTYTTYVADSSNNLFSLVSIQTVNINQQVLNARLCGLGSLFRLTAKQQDDEDSFHSVSSAMTDSLVALTTVTDLMRMESTYSLARVIMSDSQETQQEVLHCQSYKLAYHTLQFLSDLMSFSSTSSRYYMENAPSVLNSVCSTFLNTIYARMRMHYKSLYSYALLFTPAGNHNIQRITITTYEAMLNEYLNSGSITNDSIELFDIKLAQHDVELYVERTSFSGLNALTMPDPLVDQQTSYIDESPFFTDDARDFGGSHAASKRSSAAQPMGFRPGSLLQRRSRNIDGQEGALASSGMHSRQISGLAQLLDGGMDKIDGTFYLDGHTVPDHGDEAKETMHSPSRRATEHERDMSLARLPTVVLADGDTFEHALYCLQGCILVYSQLKRLIPMLPAAEDVWCTNFETTIQKILYFLILEWRLFVSMHIRRGFSEDLNAPPEQVQLGVLHSISAGYNSVITATKQIRTLFERSDFSWMMSYNVVIFDHAYYAIKRILTKELANLSSSALTGNQVARMTAALQSLCTVVDSTVDFRSVMQEIHDLCIQ